MSLYITCPRCRASLKANKLPDEAKTVNCPECGQPFQVASTGVTAATPQPKFSAAPTGVNWLPWALIASILVVGGGIIAAIVLTRTPPPAPAPETPPVVASGDPVESPSVEERDIGNKEPAKDKEKQNQEFIRLMIEGGTSLIGQRYEEAAAAYTEANKLFPEDADARQKLIEAKAALARQREAEVAEKKQREDAVQLAKKAQSAMESKQYAAALELFKLALQKDAKLTAASEGVIAARAAVNREQLDQKKLAEYEQFILSGKAAQKAGRLADAIRDFVAAQGVVPNDPIASQLQREAEKQLDALSNRAEKQKEFQRLLDQAQEAMKAKNFEQADKAYQQALRLFPNDAAAKEGHEESQKKLKSAKAEFTAWMFKGNAAGNAGSFGEAVLAFREALRLFPSDETATKALRQAEIAQEARDTYFRAMERGSQAMSLKAYGDAIVAYNEALRAAPGDLNAGQRLLDAQRLFKADQGRREDFERKAALGLKLLKSQRYADAAVELRAAAKIMPHHPQIDIVQRQARYADAMADAISAMNASRFSDAIREYQAALSEFPNDFAARQGLNRARMMNKGKA